MLLSDSGRDIEVRNEIATLTSGPCVVNLWDSDVAKDRVRDCDRILSISNKVHIRSVAGIYHDPGISGSSRRALEARR